MTASDKFFQCKQLLQLLSLLVAWWNCVQPDVRVFFVNEEVTRAISFWKDGGLEMSLVDTERR